MAFCAVFTSTSGLFEQAAQIGALVDQPAEAVHLVDHQVERLLVLGEGIQRRRVTTGQTAA